VAQTQSPKRPERREVILDVGQEVVQHSVLRPAHKPALPKSDKRVKQIAPQHHDHLFAADQNAGAGGVQQ